MAGERCIFKYSVCLLSSRCQLKTNNVIATSSQNGIVTNQAKQQQQQNNATDRQLEKFIWIPYCINNLVSFPFRCLFLVRIIFLPFFAICLICHVKSETLSLKQVDLWPFSRDLLALAMQVAYICVCGSYLLCQDFMLMLFLDFVAKDRRPIGNRFLNSIKWIGNLIFFHFATIWIECVFT